MSELLFTFVHVTDTHWCKDATGEAMLRSFVETVNGEAAFPMPDLVIHTGDIIRGYNDTIEQHYQQMREAKAVLDGLIPQTFYICHNHDTYGEDIRGTVFDEVFGSPHVQEIVRDGFYLLLLCGCLASSTIFGDIAEETEPLQWGYDLYTAKGKALLRSRLAAHPGEKKLLFSHSGLVTPRQPPIPEDPAVDLPRTSGFRYCIAEDRAAGVREILAEHGVLAHYCGNSHVNSRVEKDGVQYISTCSTADFPSEARHVTVYEDRIVNRMLPIPGGRDAPMRWPNVIDADHPTNKVYMAGVDHEREFTIGIP